MSEIALDAICDASARSKDEQFLSMLKNSATCSALQCGVFDRIYPVGGATNFAYTIAVIQRNRGDLNTGIVRLRREERDGRTETYLDKRKGLGPPKRAFGIETKEDLKKFLENFESEICIVHNMYSTTGENRDSEEILRDAQPFLVQSSETYQNFSIAFNGNICNYGDLRRKMIEERPNICFRSSKDTELIAILISDELEKIGKLPSDKDFVSIFSKLSEKLEGGYSIIYLDARGTLICARDPAGYRPLCFGYNEHLFLAASESCALDKIFYSLNKPSQIFFVEPGEIVISRGEKHLRDL